MTPKKMTRDEEHDFYSRPENQEPLGPARRRNSRLTEMVPVRFPPETLEEVRRRADADARSVSSWIRRAVDRQLEGAVDEPVSNNLANERLRTGTNDDRRTRVDKSADLRERGRRRTKPDRENPGSADS